MSHHLVETRGLSHIYPDGTLALDAVSFRITHGESVGIIGANGAGKSTLLLHLNGCLMPSDGEVRIGGMLLTPSTVPDIRRSVGMVFQNPDDQLFMSTVFEDVAFGPCNQGITGNELEQRVSAALHNVGAVHLRDKPPYHLSDGEKKRVAIATVLSMSPDVLVMDEPTNGLDPFTRRQLIQLLDNFRHTKIITSHDLDMIYQVCDRTIVLNQGKIVADGETHAVFDNQMLLEECKLEKPLAAMLCQKCREAFGK